MSNNTTNNDGALSESIKTSIENILASLAVLLNGPLLVVILKSKTPVFRSRMNYLVGNLALADCLTGIGTIVYNLPWDEPTFSDIQHILHWSTMEASFLTVVLMSVERLVVLSYPLTWPFILSTYRTVVGTVVIWLVSLGCGFLVNYIPNEGKLAVIVLFEVCILTVVVQHLVIFCHLQQRHRKFIEKFGVISESTLTNIHQASQRRATTVLLILVIILIVTALPCMIVMQIIVVCWFQCGVTPQQVMNLSHLYRYLYPVMLINFIVNPVIYAWRLKRYREAFYETFFALRHTPCPFWKNEKSFTKKMLK